jgi:TolB protein
MKPTALSLLFLLSSFFSLSQHRNIFTGFTHVGTPLMKGAMTYDSIKQEYLLEGASGNMWGPNDDFHFLFKRMKGNFILQTRIEFVGKGVDPHRKVGIMIRHSLEKNSPHVNAVVHGDGLTALQFRRAPGGQTEETRTTVSAPDMIQLERRDSIYIMSVAKFGQPFTVTQVGEVPLGEDVYAGLFLCSHNEQATEKAYFRNVREIIPAGKDLVPYRDYLGSHLEVLDIATGIRTIRFSENVSLQAPNWTVDGLSLIYNRNGLLYNFDLKTNKPAAIPSDFADKNNNDHVLSFDGKMLGISHHSKDDNGHSIVYVMPTQGGTPKRVTPLGPSYLHGWSPDGKYLIYTGGRNDEYDIYKIPVRGGKEIRLTNSKGVDDGSEYSPDGKYIYFNSARSGKMQIYRMKPDGTHPVMQTMDEYNNWFPHISPDGKWMVFLSYMPDIPAGDHPFYKHVYLRIKELNTDDPPRIIAYLYGGQGTINVPSWSPDGKQIAFVSNSGMEK